jgi:hypothetical protein
VFGIAVSQPAKAAATFGTVALTGVSDMCNLVPLGGTTQGDATAIAPQGLLIESCQSPTINVNAVADASAGIAQGNVVLSDGAYVLGSLHTAASATGPAAAHARAIFSELLNIVPTSGFADGYFNVTATFTVDGNLSGQAQAGGELQLGAYYGSDNEFNGVCAGAACTTSPVSPGAHTFVITDTVTVSTLYPYLFVQTFLDAVAGNFTYPFSNQSGAADFSNTGTLFLTLPAGFTFNSDVNNGVPSSPSTVPEPTTLALLGIGLAGLGFSRRRNLH